MKVLFRYFLISCILLCSVKLKAQQRIIDSLKNELQQNEINPHQRAMTMARLADALSYDNPLIGLKKNHEALKLARKYGDSAAISYIFAYRAVWYVISGKATLAKKSVDSALFFAQTAAPLYKGIAWYRNGYLQNMQNKPDEALKSWQKALGYLDTAGGALYRSSIYYLLYGIYAERNDTSRDAHYARLSLKAALKSKDPGMITSAWQINGTDYLQKYKESKDTIFLDSAVNAFQQSVHVFQMQKGCIKNQSVVALSALNIADIYMDHYPPWYKDSVLHYVNIALDVSVKAGNKTMQANCYDIISKLNRRDGKLKMAEQALLKEKRIVDSIQPPNYYLSINLYQSLAQLMEQKGDMSGALLYYKKYVYYYKKEFNAKQFHTIQQLEAKYQSEKKDKALKLLQQRNVFQKKKNYLYIGIAFIALMGLLFLFIAYHFRLKYSLQREKLKVEETARLKAEQKLILSQKEQLQKELLAGTLQVEHKNELLQNLKEKLLSCATDGNPARQLDKIINEELRVDEDFENIKSDFKAIHPDFFKRLHAKSQHKLTSLDLKYCTYIYMQLSAKQIANLLHVEPKSVRMARYRLKQKLGLGKEDDLDAFILEMEG